MLVVYSACFFLLAPGSWQFMNLAEKWQLLGKLSSAFFLGGDEADL